MTKNSFILPLTLLLSQVLFSQNSLAEKTEKEYDTWSIELNVGQVKGIRPYATGYYSSNPEKYFAFDGIHHYDFGVRKMFSPLFGLKLDFAYDQFSNQSGSKSLPFDTEQYRIGLQGVANLGRLLKFESFTQRLSILAHAGIQVSQFTPKSGDNLDRTEDNGGVMLGLTPQVRLTDWLALTGDFTMYSNLRQHFNWDGSDSDTSNNLSGLMYTTSVGLTVYLGKKEKHADWYIQETSPIVTNLQDTEARERIDAIETLMNDTDKDGVPDYLDSENTTPAGVAVDSRGRFIDTNKNGTPDELEKNYLNGKDGINTATASKDDALKVLVEKGYLNIFFDVNKDIPNAGSANNVYYIIRFLRQYPDAKITLTGYADKTGNEKYNNNLSVRRAQKLFDIIIASGIDASRLKIAGEGVDASNSSDFGLELARRVSIQID